MASDSNPIRTAEPLRGMYLVVCLAFSVLLFGYSALLATESHPGLLPVRNTHTRWPFLADKPLGEDGFYMLTVADNLAVTHHLAYNYGLPATGIQPLSTLVFAAIAVPVHALGGDRWTLIRAVILFGATLSIVFAWMLARFAASFARPGSRQAVFTLAFLLALLDFSCFRLFTYGLETGIYLCLIVACIALWRDLIAAAPHPRWPTVLLFGLAGGFAGLARIDFGLVFAFLLAWLLRKRLASLTQALCAGLLALLIVSPWFLFVRHVTGGWLPTSGSAESGLTWRGADRLIAWALAVVAHLAPWSFAATANVVTDVFAVLSVLFLLWLGVRAHRTRARLRNDRLLRGVFLPWAIAFGALTIVYTLAFLSSFFYMRYFAPLLVVSIPLLALAFAEVFGFDRTEPSRTSPSNGIRLALFAGALTLLFVAFDIPSLHQGRVGNPHFSGAAYLAENFPGVHIGAFQSGVIGYTSPNVENLDGKLNGGALRATKTHTMPAFIDAEGINVLFDWPPYFTLFPQPYLAAQWQPCPQPVPTGDQSICLVRRSWLAAAGLPHTPPTPAAGSTPSHTPAPPPPER